MLIKHVYNELYIHGYKNMNIQTKLLLAATTSILPVSQAMAQNGVSFETVYQHQLSGKVGSVKVDTGGVKQYKGTTVGLEYGGDVKNGNHHIPFEVSVARGTKNNHHQYEEMGAKVGYGYDVQVSDSVVIKPKASVGYQRQKLKSTNSNVHTVEVNRAYVEAGVEALVGVTDSWQIKPSITYQHDLSNKTKVGGVKTNTQKNGDAIQVEIGFNKQLSDSSDLTITPYYQQYQSKAKSTGEKTRIREAGMKVSYTF